MLDVENFGRPVDLSPNAHKECIGYDFPTLPADVVRDLDHHDGVATLAHFAAGSNLGAPIDVRGRDRHRRATIAQYRARRNAIWLDQIENGILDHLTGRLIFITVAELAGINGFTIPGIIAALASARAARALLRRVRHDF